MAITARELVFYVRAEDQASRVVKRIASSFGSLSNIRALENKQILQKAANLRAIDKAQLNIARSQTAISRAQVQASRLSRLVEAGTPLSGHTMQETANLAAAARQNVANLQQQEKLLGQDLDEVRRKGLAASAALDQQVSQAKINRLRSYATEVQNLGRALRLMGVIGVAAFAFAAHAAAGFNTSVTLAATQARLPGANTASVLSSSKYLQDQILKFLPKTPVSATDLSSGAYTIFSGLSLKGGQKQQLNEGLGILKEFSKVLTANYGQVSFNDVTKAGIALINNFGLSAGKIPLVMNQMQASVRFGAMTMGEMTSSLNQVIPAFKSAGYSTKQMFQDIAFVSRVFPSLRIGTTGLARLTETFGKYHEAISRDIGTNIAPGGKLSPVATIVQEIIKAHPTLVKGGVALQNYFKNVTGASQFVNARRVFSAYVTQLKLYHDVAGKVGKDNNELAQSFTVMNQTPQVRWKEFTNQLHMLVLEIGTKAVPVFAKIGHAIEPAIKWFDSLSKSTKNAIVVWGLIGSIGAVLGGTLLVVGGSIARFILTLKELRLLSVSSEAGFLSAGAALRLGLVGALIIAIPLMVKYHTQVMQVVNALGGLKNVMLVLATIFATWKIRAILLGLTQIAVEASTARYAIALLAGELAAIEVLGPIAVAIIVSIFYKQIGGPINKNIIQPLSHVLNKILPGNPMGDKNLTQSFVMGQLHAATSQEQVAKIVKEADTFGNAAAIASAHAFQKRFDASMSAQTKDRVQHGFGHTSGAIIAKKVKAIFAAQDKKDALTPGKGGTTPGFDINAAIKNIVKLDNLAKQTNTIANYKKAAAALKALQKHTNAETFAAAQQVISSIESAEKKSDSKRLSQAKKAAADRLRQLKDAQANVMSMYDSLLQQNQSIMGQLFQGPFTQSPSVQDRLQFGGVLGSGDLLKDLQSQNTQFTNFYNTIDKLKRRGAPNELIQQLIQAGPQALPAIKALSGMGDSQWKIYIKTFNRGQKLLHDQTVSQLKSQLKDYRKYGQGIALQIISGMRDKRLGLANEIQAIIKKMFGVNTPVVTKAAIKKIADASKVAGAKPHPKPRGSTYTGSTTNTHPVVGTGTRTTQSARTEYHYHVTAPTDEHASVQTQLRHAEFTSRTKHKGYS